MTSHVRINYRNKFLKMNAFVDMARHVPTLNYDTIRVKSIY